MLRICVIMLCLCSMSYNAVGQDANENAVAPEVDPRLQEWIDLVKSCTKENEDEIWQSLLYKLPDELADAKDENGMTLLMHACRHATKKIIGLLLRESNSPRARDNENRTGLHHLAFHHDTRVTAQGFTQFVIASQGTEHGEDIHGMTMFMLLCKENHPIDTLKKFAAYNAIHVRMEMNELDNSGNSTVSYAAMHNTDHRIWELLTMYGADLTKTYTDNQLTPLHLAARENMAEVAGAIIREGAEVDALDSRSMTPLMWALLQNKDPLMVRYLLQAKADVTHRSDQGATMTHAAAFGAQNADVFTRILEAGSPADEPVPGSPSATPARLYVQYGQDPQVWQVLADHGADLNRKPKDEAPMLMQALTSKKDFAFIKAMIVAGCDVNDPYEPFNTTPLMMACKDGPPELVELFLDHGADTTVTDVAGKTAYDSAAANPLLQGHSVLKRLKP